MIYPCYEWVVPWFILMDIYGESSKWYKGRETYSLVILKEIDLN